MGQRSQIYVRYQKDGVNYLTARYYQWNYGERMISRCRHTLEWIKEYVTRRYDWYFTTETEMLKRYLDVNFDMQSVVIGQDIIKEWEEWDYKDETTFNDFVFLQQDNNDGKLFIDIKDGVIKYAFVDTECHTEHIMNARQYMDWDEEGWQDKEYLSDEAKKICEDNVKAIAEIAELMTEEELEEFISADYGPKPF
jgi:hypothetical protein